MAGIIVDLVGGLCSTAVYSSSLESVVPIELPMTKSFNKVLVANRGEIAVRILRALRDLKICSAVIYSDADRTSLPVLLADEAYRIGPPPSLESYLRAEAIIELASEIGADAIHPGYGFLSESSSFASGCRKAGIVFIGPSPEAIAAMGSKIESRRLMHEAGVPVVPGGDQALRSLNEAQDAGRRIGYPVMLKASAGGGGKGMRRVGSEEDLTAAFRAATSEAQSSFGDGSVYIEKLLVRPRHIEVQLIGDRHGRLVAIGTRECSLQRRHQKVVEEAPSPALDEVISKRLERTAVQAAKAIDYYSVGTIEFLLDRSGEFYFLEMNTRLQVEHPVTEMVSGLDLVGAQIKVAQGLALEAVFDDAEIRGHSIEVRIYAEDPFEGFVPSPGTIDRLRWPEGPGVRTDAGVVEGGEVSIFYDSLLAKLIVWGSTRLEALERLGRALEELKIEGLQTTVPLYKALLKDRDFGAGNLDVEMLDRKLKSGELEPEQNDDSHDLHVIAAVLEHIHVSSKASDPAPTSASAYRSAWGAAARREATGGMDWN
jgi:acetyl-CoA carboxylase biotin carboxylase subunit